MPLPVGTFRAALEMQVPMVSGQMTGGGTLGVAAGTEDELLRAFQSNGTFFLVLPVMLDKPVTCYPEADCGDENRLDGKT